MAGANNTSKKNSTRKRKIVATTIPELKRSFDALEDSVSDILRSGGTPAQRVKKFQVEWRKIFGRPVDAKAAEAYLHVKSRKGTKAGKKTRKAGRYQKGGAAGGGTLAGAPLDFQTRPGVDGVHGSFPQYVSQGMSFYNTINQEGMFKDCGIVDITPKVPVSIGSNQAGGGVLADSLQSIISSRPFVSSAPPTFLQDAQDGWMGKSLGQSPSASQTQLKYM